MDEAERKRVHEYDVLQVDADGENWSACLIIVDEVRDWGVQGFTPMPPNGARAYIRVPWERLNHTGGVAIFVPAPPDEA